MRNSDPFIFNVLLSNTAVNCIKPTKVNNTTNLVVNNCEYYVSGSVSTELYCIKCK